MVTEYDLTERGMNVELAYQQERDAGAYAEIFERYRDPGTKYAFAVLESRVPGCEDIQLQCWRHLQDLARQDADDFPYHYDLAYCHEVLNFAAECPEVATGEPLPLDLWQQAIFCWSQGWRDENDERRFHQVIFSVSRTNGKTYITNILMAYQYTLGCAGVYNADMAYIAPVTQQSKKGWRYVKMTFMKLMKRKKWSRLFAAQRVKIGEDVVKSPVNQNQLMRMSHESGQFDAYHFAFAVSDEAGDDGRIGLIKENNGKITSGQVQTPNHQFWQISTAYPDSTSQLYKDEGLVREAMKHDAKRELDDMLLINFTQDSEDEVDKPETWPKSNPILALKGDTMLRSMIAERDKKMLDGSVPEFINKNLNMWLKVKEDRFLNPHDIEDAVMHQQFDIGGRDVYVGFDLSKLADDTAVGFVYPYKVGDEVHYYVQQHSWVPTSHTGGNIAQKEKQDGINYRAAEAQGYATIARNRFGYIDENSVTDWILDYAEQYQLNVHFFIYDRWNASDTVEKMQTLDMWPMMPLKQTADKLDKPTREFRKALQTGHIHYGPDPILQYALANAIVVSNSAGVKIDKDRATSKIDCVDAIINAMARAIYHFSDYDPDDDSKDKSLFSGMSDEQVDGYYKSYSF